MSPTEEQKAVEEFRRGRYGESAPEVTAFRAGWRAAQGRVRELEDALGLLYDLLPAAIARRTKAILDPRQGANVSRGGLRDPPKGAI